MIKTRTKLAAIIFASIWAAFLLARSNAFAALDDSMRGSGSSDSSSSSGSTSSSVDCSDEANSYLLYCSGWSWVKYSFVDGAPEGTVVYFEPYTKEAVSYDDSGIYISGNCAKKGGGFWHLGRNYKASRYGLFDIYSSSPTYSYTSSATKMGHRETYNYDYLKNLWAGGGALLREKQYDDKDLDHKLYANGKLIYQATEYGEWDEVVAEYQKAGGVGSIPGDMYAFCAYGGEDPQTYTAEVELEIYDSETISVKHDERKDEGFVPHKVSSSNIKYNGKGVVWPQDSNSSQQKTSYSVTITPSGKSVSDLSAGGYWNGPADDSEINLVPGIVYNLCATNHYASSYDGDFGGWQDISACTQIVYDVDCADFSKADGTKHTVGEHENYGRMKISGKGDLSVGDGASGDTADYWVTKDDKITLRYYGCMGVQAAYDGGSGGEVVYEIDNNISPLYLNTNNYVASNSHAGQSIGGYELNIVGTKWTADGTNTLADRIHTNYQFGGDSSVTAKTSAQKTATGNQYLKTMSWSKKDGTTKKVSITVKNPYNYYLNPSISNIDSGKLTLGSTISANVSVTKNGRANEKLGVSGGSSDVDYKTNTTIARAWLVSLPSSVTQGSLNDALSTGTTKLDGDYFYTGDSSSLPIDRLSSVEPKKLAESDINIGSDDTVLEATISDSEEVGSKLCVMSAVWPADSHNILPNGEDYTIKNSDDQSNALMGDNAGTNPYWRFEMNCQTVGKYPNISVESASLVASGEVSTATIKYNGGIFGSWSEYDLIANGAKNIGSGASLAYANAYTKNYPNDAGDFNVDGGRGSSNYYPQSVGNKDGSNSSSDASEIYKLSSKFADSLISYCGDSESTSTGECTFANSVPDDGNGIYVYNGGFPIANNIINNSKNAIMVIVGDNVAINKDVTRVDAIIIARNSFDTCAGDGNDRNPADGNQDLLENCNNQLVINGAVKTAGGDNLKLDRTFGGGSITGEDKLNPSTLMQRAEIFNYDPRIVKVSQDIWEKTDATNVQYVKELAPRL